jgi:hypothetical protein
MQRSDLPQKLSSIRDPLADHHVNGEYLKTHPTGMSNFRLGRRRTSFAS